MFAGTDKIPLVSVVMPCYNAERYVRESLESICAQEYQAVEIIVINDGSTDSSPKILKEFADRIRLINQHNMGPAIARNAGINAARGEYVAFCDSDDIWLPDKLRRQMDVFRKHPEVGVVACLVAVIDRHGMELPYGGRRTELCDRVVDLKDILLDEGNPVCMSSAVVRKDLLKRVGGFNANKRLLSEDYDLWIRVSFESSYYISSERLLKYRVLPCSVSHGTTIKEYKPQFQWLYVHCDKYTRERFRLRRSKIYRDWAGHSFFRKERGAWKLMWKSAKLDRGNKKLKLKVLIEMSKSLLRNGYI